MFYTNNLFIFPVCSFFLVIELVKLSTIDDESGMVEKENIQGNEFNTKSYHMCVCVCVNAREWFTQSAREKKEITIIWYAVATDDWTHINQFKATVNRFHSILEYYCGVY